MAGKKLHKFCRIYQWVEAKDPDLAGAIRDLCMEGALSGGRHSGATFIYPSAAVRKQIVKDAYSADPEKAIRVLEAHIISEGVRTAAEIRKGVGSRLGIQLEVESGSGASVTLKGGAKLKVAEDFHPLRKDNIAVWEVESGEVPLEGPEYKPPARGRAPRASGGRDGAAKARGYRGGNATGPRLLMAKAVEQNYSACMRADRCRSRDPYLTHSVSLLNFLKLQHPDLLAKVLPMIDRDPAVTFYLLLEPYKTQGSDYVLDNSVLFGREGWNGVEIFETAVTDFEGFFETVDPSIADTQAVRSAIDNVRLQILGEDGRRANKVSTPKEVRSVYKTLIAQNSIAGVQPILPQVTVEALPGDKKVWQDELRFMLHASLQEVRQSPIYDEGDFAAILEMLAQHPGNDYAKEAVLSNAELLQSNVAPQDEFMLLVKFINSTDFLYVPVSAENVGGAWGDVPVVSGPSAFYDAGDLNVYNAEASKQKLLGWYKVSGGDEPRGLDPGTIAAVRLHMSRHGELPPGLRGINDVNIADDE